MKSGKETNDIGA